MTFEEVNHIVQSNLTEKDEENSSLEWDDSPDQYDLEERHSEFDDLTDPIFQSLPSLKINTNLTESQLLVILLMNIPLLLKMRMTQFSSMTLPTWISL